MRLLFLHGLESGPSGAKTRIMRKAGHDVLAPDMRPLLLWPMRACKGIGAIVPLVWIAWSAYMLLDGRHAIGAFCIALALTLAAVVALNVVLHRMIARCKSLLYVEMARFRPQVLVGSSWGGALLVFLIADGTWMGPSLILASAHQLLARYMLFSRVNHTPVLPANDEAQEAYAQLGPIILVHGRQDERCAASAVTELEECYRAAGIPSRTLLEDDDHALRRTFKPQRVNEYLVLMQEAVDRLLKDCTDVDN